LDARLSESSDPRRERQFEVRLIFLAAAGRGPMVSSLTLGGLPYALEGLVELAQGYHYCPFTVGDDDIARINRDSTATYRYIYLSPAVEGGLSRSSGPSKDGEAQGFDASGVSGRPVNDHRLQAHALGPSAEVLSPDRSRGVTPSVDYQDVAVSRLV